MSTAGGVLVWLNWPLLVENTKLIIIWHLALVQTFLARLIRQAGGMVIAQERQQVPMETLYNAPYHCEPGFSVGTTYIISISTIRGVVHLLPLMVQTDSMQWYFSNTIDLNAFKLFYMKFIRFNV